MRMYDIIEKKRDGKELSADEIKFLVSGITSGDIPDYQLSAFCMAVYFSGMTYRETADFTMAMYESGEKADLSQFGNLTSDKHSTGGVGDKTTFIAAPIAASLGVITAKMSGRGLGFTGGTADKLEAVRGYKAACSSEEFIRNVKKVGMAVVTQTGNFAPADKKLYALRDVTATVDSLPLIASSVMSKKLACGAENIILDVKVGCGALMKTVESARRLAEIMVSVGKACGRNTIAVLTDMNEPLGRTVGNSLEIAEAAAFLQGDVIEDLGEVSITLAAHMVSSALNIRFKKAMDMCWESVKNGSAYKKFCEWLTAQGGDISFLNDLKYFCKARNTVDITASKSGYISKINAHTVGETSVLLGAGRAKVGDSIDITAGIYFYKKTGDRVSVGEPIARLQSSSVADFTEATALMKNTVDIESKPPCKKHMIIDTIKY